MLNYSDPDLDHELQFQSVTDLRSKYARLFINELEYQNSLNAWHDVESTCGPTCCPLMFMTEQTTTQRLANSRELYSKYIAKHARLQAMTTATPK